MIPIKKINNEKITAIPLKKHKPKDILGYDLFPLLYCNIFLCAQKNSGKTTVINKIIDSCIDKKTKVIVFCSTHKIDGNWLYIQKKLEKKNIPSLFYSSLIDDHNVNTLDEVLQFMQASKQAEKLPEKEFQIQILKIDDHQENIKLKIKKKKQKSPKFLIIFDDMSTELKIRDVHKLLTTFRHYEAKCIISSQYFNDLSSGARLQIDYFILFKGQSEKKLEDIYDNIGSDISKNSFIKLYHEVTSQQYTFLYIDRNKPEFRKNFNKKICI